MERQSTGARKTDEDAEAAVQQQQHDMKHAGIAGLTTRQHKMMFEGMMVAIGDSLSDLESFDYGEDGEDEDDDETEQGKLSKNDEHSWVIGTISKTAEQHMERFRQKQMKLDKLSQPGWEDAAAYFRERDNK